MRPQRSGGRAARSAIVEVSPRKKAARRLPFLVEMGGVEPPSKQRPRELSTRLFLYTLIPPLVVDLGLPKDGPAGAYPLNLGGA